MFQSDAANTGHNSAAIGPTDVAEEHWRVGTDGCVSAGSVVVGDIVYVSSLDGNLYALDTVNGASVWNEPFDAGNGIFGSPAVTDSTVPAEHVTIRYIE